MTDLPDMQGAAGTGSLPGDAGAWGRIARRVWTGIGRDRVLLVAAGTTFYLLLALFPTISAFVSLYGLVGDPTAIADDIDGLAAVVPQVGLDLIRERLEILLAQDRQALGLRFLLAAAIALWSANSGVKALFEAMNVAFGEREKRSFIGLNLLALAFTLAAMLAAAVLIAAVAVVPLAFHLLRLDAHSQLLVTLLRWPVLLALIACGISLLYRYGPSRPRTHWRWVSFGGVFATVGWLAVSVGFSVYLARFAHYEATYGSLGAVIGFMVWTWLSVVTLIVGAEIDAEVSRDSASPEPAAPNA